MLSIGNQHGINSILSSGRLSNIKDKLSPGSIQTHSENIILSKYMLSIVKFITGWENFTKFVKNRNKRFLNDI